MHLVYGQLMKCLIYILFCRWLVEMSLCHEKKEQQKQNVNMTTTVTTKTNSFTFHDESEQRKKRELKKNDRLER